MLLAFDDLAAAFDEIRQGFIFAGRKPGKGKQTLVQAPALRIDVVSQIFGFDLSFPHLGRFGGKGSVVLRPNPHFPWRSGNDVDRFPEPDPLLQSFRKPLLSSSQVGF